MIQVKRVYDPAGSKDGTRFLVDRLWPRGVKKEDLKLDAWLKDVAPSAGLRTWFHHEPAHWEEFLKRYFHELDANPETWQPIAAAARKGTITLLFSAKDTEQNNALALKSYLEQKTGIH
jgi:uncharacterized protein YeaO (DUF488 family)